MIFRTMLAAIALALAACAAPSSAPPTPVQADAGPVKPPVLETQAACNSYGGEWRPICRMQKPACVVSFKDAGKSCSDSSECSGRCTLNSPGNVQPGTATKGTCTANSDPCGCFQLVTNGKADYTLCAD
jgi:hypothetical protein